jgi:hypothetical protein
MSFEPSQRTSVELRLSLVLIDGQVFYLRLNELVVQNGEQTPISGHTLAGQDLHYQRFLQVWTNLYLYMHLAFVTSKVIKNYYGLIISSNGE